MDRMTLAEVKWLQRLAEKRRKRREYEAKQQQRGRGR